MTEPLPGGIYVIELCSGELRRWQYLGPDVRTAVWWRDQETGQEFNEGSLMYAWHIVSEQEAPIRELEEPNAADGCRVTPPGK